MDTSKRTVYYFTMISDSIGTRIYSDYADPEYKSDREEYKIFENDYYHISYNKQVYTVLSFNKTGAHVYTVLSFYPFIRFEELPKYIQNIINIHKIS